VAGALHQDRLALPPQAPRQQATEVWLGPEIAIVCLPRE
jgi:hypothetical protein